MQPKISTIIKYLDSNPKYEEASKEELIRCRDLLLNTAADIDMLLAGEVHPKDLPL